MGGSSVLDADDDAVVVGQGGPLEEGSEGKGVLAIGDSGKGLSG